LSAKVCHTLIRQAALIQQRLGFFVTVLQQPVYLHLSFEPLQHANVFSAHVSTPVGFNYRSERQRHQQLKPTIIINKKQKSRSPLNSGTAAYNNLSSRPDAQHYSLHHIKIVCTI